MSISNKVQQSEFARVAEVAAALGVTKKTVWRWAQRGIIPSYKLAHSTFFRWEDINTTMSRCASSSLNGTHNNLSGRNRP